MVRKAGLESGKQAGERPSWLKRLLRRKRGHSSRSLCLTLLTSVARSNSTSALANDALSRSDLAVLFLELSTRFWYFSKSSYQINTIRCWNYYASTHLFVLSFLDNLLERLNAISRQRRRLYDSRFNHVDFLKKVGPELNINLLELDSSFHCSLWSIHGLVTGIVVISPDYWRIYRLKSMNKALLGSEYVSPRISPSFRRIDDLWGKWWAAERAFKVKIETTLESILSASSKSLRRTATWDSSAVLGKNLPKRLCTLCMLPTQQRTSTPDTDLDNGDS